MNKKKIGSDQEEDLGHFPTLRDFDLLPQDKWMIEKFETNNEGSLDEFRRVEKYYKRKKIEH